MKKTLVAIAAVAAVTGAMAEATITGRFDAAINGTDTTTTLGSGPNGGSEFVIGISEDLGNGITGTAAMTVIGSVTGMSTAKNATDVAPSATGFGMYQSHIGLAGEFGSVRFGAQWNPIFLASTVSDISGRWNGASLTNPGELQNFNSITYSSPNISGFTFSYQSQLTDSTYIGGYDNDHASTGGSSDAYSLQYASGALAAVYANSTDGNYGAVGTSATSTLTAVSYDFGVAKLHYGHLVSDVVTSGTDVTSNSYGVTVPVGAFVLGAQNSSNNAGGTTNNYIINYSLSKKTLVYFDNTDASGAKTNRFGITMTF